MPKDRITQLHQGYGFIEFLGEEDADYAIKVMNMIKVYGKPIRVNKVHLSYVYMYVWNRLSLNFIPGIIWYFSLFYNLNYILPPYKRTKDTKGKIEPQHVGVSYI